MKDVFNSTFKSSSQTVAAYRARGFRLDIVGDEINDKELADYLVRDLRLLMLNTVRIANKQIIVEPHQRRSAQTAREQRSSGQFIDLSHTVEDGLITYNGLPAPVICDYLSREQSRAHYADGTEFQIGRIEMVANTGTHLDSPFHRFASGQDLAELNLLTLADLDTITVHVTGMRERAISSKRSKPCLSTGKRFSCIRGGTYSGARNSISVANRGRFAWT